VAVYYSSDVTTIELDNPAWYALNGPHQAIAQRADGGQAAQYDPEISVFAAVADDVEPQAWDGLGELAGERGYVVLARRRSPEAPDSWRYLKRWPVTQYVAQKLDKVDLDGIVELGPDDAEEMVDLTARTEPGPFLARTVEMGRYLGIRQEGKLVAMAGERLRLPGWTEVSAVCVDPSARRQGLAGRLTLAVAHQIRDRGSEAMLHVRFDNHPAHNLYQAIGFEARAEVEMSILSNRPRSSRSAS